MISEGLVGQTTENFTSQIFVARTEHTTAEMTSHTLVVITLSIYHHLQYNILPHKFVDSFQLHTKLD